MDPFTDDIDCALSSKTPETLSVLDGKEPVEDMHSPVLRRFKHTVNLPERLNL